MRNIVFLFLLLLSKANAEVTPLNIIREVYGSAAINENDCKKLILLSVKYSSVVSPTIDAYNACGTMMMAKYVYNPISKLSCFREGKKLLEKCIRTNNENIEMRYLRFTIQSKSPAFLLYNNSIEKDKLFLLKSIENVEDLQLKKMIVSFLKSSEYLSSREKQNLLL